MCSLTKDKTAVSKETSQLLFTDWINIALDWPVDVYFLRAHQRHLANLRCKDLVSLPFLLHTPFLHPDNKVSQSDDSLSLASFSLSLSSSILAVISGGLSGHHWVKFYLTHQVSQQNNPDAQYNPDQQLLSDPLGPHLLIFMMPANNWKDIHHTLIDTANQLL